MIAITTSSSMRVKPDRAVPLDPSHSIMPLARVTGPSSDDAVRQLDCDPACRDESRRTFPTRERVTEHLEFEIVVG
jgi:hypothetical protein